MVWRCVCRAAGKGPGQVVKTALQRVSQARARGQCVGRCRMRAALGRAIRAEMLIRCARRVAPRAVV